MEEDDEAEEEDERSRKCDGEAEALVGMRMAENHAAILADEAESIYSGRDRGSPQTDL